MSYLSHYEALLRTIDQLIIKHGSKHPEVVPDMIALREQLQEAARKKLLREVSTIALQVATVVKFIRDWLP